MAKADIERRPPKRYIAECLGDYRRARGMTQAELAERAGVSVWTIKKIEGGHRGIGTSALGKISQVLGPDFTESMLGVLSAD